MASLYLLGTGAAVSDPHRTTTMLAFADGGSTLLVDCGGDVLQRMMAAGLAVDSIEALVVTHEHPDHVSGFPLFMEKIWLAGRRRPIPVHGPAAGLAQARRLWEAFNTDGWTGVPETQWTEVPLEEHASLGEIGPFRVTASPSAHSVPCIGLRVEADTGTVAYSCDTAPSDSIVRLSTGVDILVHEAGGDYKAHTTIEQAAHIAARANAGRLLLVHLPPGHKESDLDAARSTFAEVAFGKEGGRYPF